METIDSDTQKLVAEYSDFTCSAKVQDDTHFNFEVPKLEKDSYLIKTIQVKVWYYDDGGYYDHEWFPGRKMMMDHGLFQFTGLTAQGRQK